jgi:hypothetical protein
VDSTTALQKWLTVDFCTDLYVARMLTVQLCTGGTEDRRRFFSIFRKKKNCTDRLQLAFNLTYHTVHQSIVGQCFQLKMYGFAVINHIEDRFIAIRLTKIDDCTAGMAGFLHANNFCKNIFFFQNVVADFYLFLIYFFLPICSGIFVFFFDGSVF